MRQRLGAILCLALGAVLIWSGLSSTASGTIGGLGAPCQPPVGAVSPCPTGTINFAETTNPAAGVPVPASWTITVTSTCDDPTTGAPVDQTIDVPNGDNTNTGPLYVFTSTTHTTSCEYTYVETPVAGYTTTYDPPPPSTIPFAGGPSNSGLKVTVTNTALASSTTTPQSTAPSSPSPSSSTAPSSTTPVVSPSASSSPVLATTGPRQSVRPALIVGIALCVLGLVLLFAGRASRLNRQHN